MFECNPPLTRRAVCVGGLFGAVPRVTGAGLGRAVGLPLVAALLDDGRLRSRQAGDRDSVGGAGDVVHAHAVVPSSQLVPCMIRGAVKPQSGRANGGEAAAKAVRTATKLSHRVTERYGAGF